MSCNEWKDTEIGKMPVSWDYAPMEEYVEINMGQSPKSEFYNTVGEGLPFLQGNRTFGLKYPYYDTYTSEIKKRAQQGDILFSVRAPVGDVNIATEEICIGRGIASLKMKNGNQEYLYYLLRMYRRHIENRESGTVFGSINKKGLEELKLPFPPLEEQEKIANILSSLDDKIELNNEMNKTLEEMAKTLFKRWFVDFEFPNEDGEPYKSSGGDMVESEFGMIPKGWEVKPLGDICDVKGGKRLPKGKTVLDKKTDYPYLRVTDITSGYVDMSNIKYIDEETREKISRYIIEYNDLYISIAGTIGIVGSINKELDGASLTENMARILCNKIGKYYMKLYLNSDEIQNVIKTRAVGSTQPKLPLYVIKGIPVLLATENVMNVFNNIVSSSYENIESNLTSIEKIVDIRDCLLPKLMSGELKI